MSINSVKEDEEQKDSVKIKVIMRLFGYMLKYKKQIAFVLVCMFIALGISIVNPLLLQRAIDVDIVNGNWKGLVIIVAVSLVLSIIYMVSARMWMKTMAHVSNDVLLTIRDELYTHIQTLSFSFFDSRPTGKILSRVIGDVNSLKDVIQSTVTQLLPDFLTVIVVLVMMIIVNPYLTLSAVAALPVIFAGMYITEILAHKRWQVFRKKSSNISAFVHEDLSGIGIVQSFTAEKESEKEFDGLVKEHQQSFIKAVALADVFSPTIEISWGIGTFLLYFIGIIIGILFSLLLKNSAFKGEPIPFVMELPNYRFPSSKSVWQLIWNKAKDFITRAFTIIFVATIIIWFLQTFDLRLNVVYDSSKSLLSGIGGFISPIFAPLGFGDWRISTALITGFTAKESVVSTLTVLLGGKTSALSTLFTPFTAFVFLIFTLLYTPCVAAIACVKRELGSRKAALEIVLLQCGIAWIVAFIIHTIGSLLGIA